MSLRFLTVGFLLLFAISGSVAQVTFTARPVSMQVYPRDGNDSAAVNLVGAVSPGFLKAIFTMHKNGILADSTVFTLSFIGNSASFQKTYKIHAEKSHFRFRMYLFNGITSSLVSSADSVCSGDAYIVTGQSNAAAAANGPGSDPQYIWVRSFGTQSNVDVTCQADTTWGMANGASLNNHMSIGVWSSRLGRMLADTSGIPVCIINGARGSSRIIDHLPYTDHADLTSYYGRLLYRARKAHVEDKVKALFWYQGESDADTAYLQYANRFSQLYNAWKQDYVSLQKIVVVQIRPGCLVSNGFLYHQQLREVMRSFQNIYSDVTVTTTVGVPEFDGCHFSTIGYQALASQMYYEFCDEFIGRPQILNSDPPHLLGAVYTNNDNTEVSLLFDQDVDFPSSYNGYNLRDYLYLNSSATIAGGFACHDTVKLQLSRSCNADKISYLPGIYYTGTTNEYQGPWLLNSRNVGVPSFYQLAISNNLAITADHTPSICPSDSVVLSTLHTGQTYQWYRNGILIGGAIQQQYIAKSDGSFTLVMKDADSIPVTSNAINVSYTSGAKPVIVSANGSNTFCSGSSLTLMCNEGVSWLWNTGETTSSITVTATGNYTISNTTANGCTGVSDTFVVTLNNLSKPVITPDKAGLCAGDSVKLSINTYPSMLWSNGSTESFIYVKDITAYTVSITDSIGCNVVSDSFFLSLNQPPVSEISASSLHACPGQTIPLTAAGPASSYLWSTGQTTSGITVSASGTYTLTITDQFGCTGISPSVDLNIAPPSISISPSGTNVICSGTSQLLTAVSNYPAGSYQWYKGKPAIANATKSDYLATAAGSYTVKFTDDYGCTATSAPSVISVSALPTATFTITDQFDFCNDTLVTLTANSGTGYTYQWQKDLVDIPGADGQVYSTQGKGSYRVIVSNAAGCTKVAAAKKIPITAPPPVASFTISDQFDVCSDTVATLTATTATGLLYQWQLNMVSIPSANDSVYVTQARGSYRVVTTNAAGCTKASTAKTLPIADPTATVTASGPLTFCSGDSVILTANTGTNYSYQWLKSSATIAGAVDISYSIKAAGSYRVRVTNAIGCTALSAAKNVKVNNCGSRHINETIENEKEDLFVYPQPFSKEFTLQLPGEIERSNEFHFELRNIAGTLVMQSENLIFNSNETTINAEILAPGLYFFQLWNNRNIYHGSLLKN